MDDKQRIALVETRTQGSDSDVPTQLIRYQLGNHLGSVSLELDDTGRIISYEEYFAYGSTSYQWGRSGAEVRSKYYRYTGLERDQESGLAYHGNRYYAPWLGRWCCPDPTGLAEGPNLYLFVRGNPLALVDLTGKEGAPSPNAQPFTWTPAPAAPPASPVAPAPPTPAPAPPATPAPAPSAAPVAAPGDRSRSR